MLTQYQMITISVLFLQAMTLSVFWIVVPRRLRWNRVITYCVVLVIYGVNLLLNAGVLQTNVINAPGFLRGSMLVHPQLLSTASVSPLFRILRMLWGVGMTGIICWIVSKEETREKLVVSGCNLCLLVLAEIIVEVVLYIDLGLHAVTQKELWTVLQAQSTIIFLGLATVFATFWHRLDGRLRHNISLMVVLMEILQFAFMIGLWGNTAEEQTGARMAYFLLCSWLAVAADFLIFEGVAGMLGAQNSEMELQRLRQQQKTESAYYQLVQTNMEEMTHCCQVLRQQLEAMEQMMDIADAEQQERALREINLRLNDITPVRYCASPVVNAIVTVKAEEARRRGIDMQVQTQVNNWNISEIDQSNLFSNLLDNALEGCLSDKTDQFIHVKAGEQRGFYFVRVSNSCDPRQTLDHSGLPATTKRNARRHGYGMKILQSIAKRYHGDMELTCQNGMFTATILMENNGHNDPACYEK